MVNVMTSNSVNKTNAVSFGNYGIILDRDQLSYYIKGNLIKVVEVGPTFSMSDLFNLASKISMKANLGQVKFCTKTEILK